ncbi:hypothetical protein NTHI1209_01659 [Haemophilus influenzae]|uniref:Uncharacterized protein n=1 Tax=Haemophilus influenzae TaxID=727 RepID=A0A158SYT2_HAEIF|nr:hypothetical protein NTHI1209_01659 [Haemophilus influenzae]
MLNECYKDATSNIQKCDREQQILIKNTVYYYLYSKNWTIRSNRIKYIY